MNHPDVVEDHGVEEHIADVAVAAYWAAGSPRQAALEALEPGVSLSIAFDVVRQTAQLAPAPFSVDDADECYGSGFAQVVGVLPFASSLDWKH